jgi:hypothetical protein
MHIHAALRSCVVGGIDQWQSLFTIVSDRECKGGETKDQLQQQLRKESPNLHWCDERKSSLFVPCDHFAFVLVA